MFQVGSQWAIAELSCFQQLAPLKAAQQPEGRPTNPLAKNARTVPASLRWLVTSQTLAPHATSWRNTGECARSRLRLTPLRGGDRDSYWRGAPLKRRSNLKVAPRIRCPRMRALTLAPHATLWRKPGSARAHACASRHFVAETGECARSRLRLKPLRGGTNVATSPDDRMSRRQECRRGTLKCAQRPRFVCDSTNAARIIA